jgi:hypothetical protein
MNTVLRTEDKTLKFFRRLLTTQFRTFAARVSNLDPDRIGIQPGDNPDPDPGRPTWLPKKENKIMFFIFRSVRCQLL